MKAVKDVERFGKYFCNDFEVGLPHVGADDFDLVAVLWAKFFEECSQGVFLAVFDNVEESLTFWVDLIDQRHVVMAFVVSDFIDSKGGDVCEFTVFKAVIDDPLHGTINLVP